VDLDYSFDMVATRKLSIKKNLSGSFYPCCTFKTKTSFPSSLFFFSIFSRLSMKCLNMLGDVSCLMVLDPMYCWIFFHLLLKCAIKAREENNVSHEKKQVFLNAKFFNS